MRIGDNFAFHIRPPFPDPGKAGRQTVISSYFLTREALGACAAVLRALGDCQRGERRGLLLYGPPGVGKTHLIRYLINLVDHPEDPAWNSLETELGGKARPDRSISATYVTLPEDPSIHLGFFLAGEIERLTGVDSTKSRLAGSISPDNLDTWIHHLSFPKSSLIIVIDDLSRRISALPNEGQRQQEEALIRIFLNACLGKDLFPILIGEEGASFDIVEAAGLRGSPPEHEWPVTAARLGAANIAQVISGALASKDNHQKIRIGKIFERLKEKLPQFAADVETLTDLYPIHPSVFEALFGIRALFPSFNPLQFAHLAIKASRTRPAERLVTIDWLLDYIMTDLENHSKYSELAHCYGEFIRTVIPQMKTPIQQRASDLMKAIAVLTICRTQPATVTTLANDLLLFDEADVLPSYSLTAAILSEMEVHGGQYLEAEGELHERRYVIAGSAKPAMPSAAPVAVLAQSSEPATGKPATAKEAKRLQSPPPPAADEEGAIEWLEVLVGKIAERDLESLRVRFITWWSAHASVDSEAAAAACSELPESLLTTQLSKELQNFSKTLARLAPVFNRLARAETDIVEAMEQTAAVCARDKVYLAQWKATLEGWPGLAAWLHGYDKSRGYLCGAYPTAVEEVEQMREGLLAMTGEPVRFLEAPQRESFDRDFETFRKQYADYYCTLHNRVLHLVDGENDGKPAIDAVALRNLELLSGLHYTSKSHLNRVRIIGRWIESNQCSLPVRQILKHSPRCYCNFNPAENRYVGDFIQQINGVIAEGIEYFRALLRSCRTPIIQELKAMEVDDHHSKQIAALLSRGPMIALRPHSIEILNQVIQKHSADFLTQVRRHGP